MTHVNWFVLNFLMKLGLWLAIMRSSISDLNKINFESLFVVNNIQRMYLLAPWKQPSKYTPDNFMQTSVLYNRILASSAHQGMQQWRHKQFSIKWNFKKRTLSWYDMFRFYYITFRQVVRVTHELQSSGWIHRLYQSRLTQSMCTSRYRILARYQSTTSIRLCSFDSDPSRCEPDYHPLTTWPAASGPRGRRPGKQCALLSRLRRPLTFDIRTSVVADRLNTNKTTFCGGSADRLVGIYPSSVIMHCNRQK